MTTTTTRAKEPASSSSASGSSGSYEVFLSFEGEDTRWTFVDHLYTVLTNAGFHTFRDDDEIQRGESITVEQRRAIEESRVSIVVLSRSYASSRRCLDELAMILGRWRRGDSGHVVVPVFYGVDPSDVRKQKGVYAEAFARHEERFKFEVGEGEAAKEWKEKLKGWRKALEEVAAIAGIPFPDGGDRSIVISSLCSMITTTRGKEPSSSSSASRSSGNYEVFLSFRGEDTRSTFVDHLQTSLTNAGFRTFRDDDEIQIGESIKVELRRAIEESRVSIVVFSRNYASSSWCLDELAMILGNRQWRDSSHVVLPVFYGVDPSDVRKQKGFYAEAFARHDEERLKFEVGVGEAVKDWKEKLKGWRDALEEVAAIAGMPLSDGGDRYESNLIKKIVKAVEDKLRGPRALNAATYPIGLDSYAKNINLWLQDGRVDDELRGPRGKELAFSSSPSSFAFQRSSSYHVFLSFRGEDTRWTFVDHLYTALTHAGFCTFRDDDEIQRGESMEVQLRRAIKESRVSIVVLSRNYASSSWCLDELAMILERRCRGDSGHVVLPVFYGVDLSDVRKQKGVYAEAFARHEERFKFEVGEGEVAKEWKEKLKGWREALEKVAGLAMPLPDGGVRDSKLIQEIVKVVEDNVGGC